MVRLRSPQEVIITPESISTSTTFLHDVVLAYEIITYKVVLVSYGTSREQDVCLVTGRYRACGGTDAAINACLSANPDSF